MTGNIFYRFYRVLYEKLLTPEFITTSHNMQFLNLIFKAMKADVDVKRVTSFTKRILQVGFYVIKVYILMLIMVISKLNMSILFR
jgi:ribosome biogenesis protein MAK21